MPPKGGSFVADLPGAPLTEDRLELYPELRKLLPAEAVVADLPGALAQLKGS
jgi:hypothetical protein